jgi:hypothetical protein
MAIHKFCYFFLTYHQPKLQLFTVDVQMHRGFSTMSILYNLSIVLVSIRNCESHWSPLLWPISLRTEHMKTTTRLIPTSLFVIVWYFFATCFHQPQSCFKFILAGSGWHSIFFSYDEKGNVGKFCYCQEGVELFFCPRENVLGHWHPQDTPHHDLPP